MNTVMITNLRAKKGEKNSRPGLQSKFTQKSFNDHNLIQRKSSLRNSLSKNQLYAEEFIIAESPAKVRSKHLFLRTRRILTPSLVCRRAKPRKC